MNLKDMKIIPIWNVFVLFLIIASNYIGELFPCQVQELLTSNVYLKHIISYLTLLFFVVLTDTSSVKKKFKEIFYESLKLYVVFLLLINCNKNLFALSILLLAVIYIIQLIKQDYIDENTDTYQDSPVLKNIKNIEKICYILFFVIAITGFIVYMGEKKIEYKDKFSYKTFIFGKPTCRGKSPTTNYVESFLSAFK